MLPTAFTVMYNHPFDCIMMNHCREKRHKISAHLENGELNQGSSLKISMYVSANAVYCFWFTCGGMSVSIIHCDLKKGKRILKPLYVEENVP